MTDRHILELAARARYGADAQYHLLRGWNPLDDDGDALRLAVALGLCVTVFLKQGDVWVGYSIGNDGLNVVELLGDDPDVATRRAIVAAAASIGSTL